MDGEYSAWCPQAILNHNFDTRISCVCLCDVPFFLLFAVLFLAAYLHLVIKRSIDPSTLCASGDSLTGSRQPGTFLCPELHPAC